MATAKRRPAAKKKAAKSKAEAAKRVIAWQVQKMMETQHISKAQLARDLEASRLFGVIYRTTTGGCPEMIP